MAVVGDEAATEVVSGDIQAILLTLVDVAGSSIVFLALNSSSYVTGDEVVDTK